MHNKKSIIGQKPKKFNIETDTNHEIKNTPIRQKLISNLWRVSS